MNPFKLKASLLLLLGGLMTASTATAAITYTAGDIFLGFRSTDSNITQSYLVNIGSGSHFRDATGSFSVGNFSSDLSTVFGSSWATRADVYWGVVGANTSGVSAVDGDPARTLYSSLASNGLIPLADPLGPNQSSSSGQSAPAIKITDMKNNFLNYASSAATGPNAAITTSADSASYASLAGGYSKPFNYFAVEMEGTFAGGASGTSLDLFRTPTGSSAGRGTYEGTFLIDGSGNLTFNVVPEPTGSACLMLSGLILASRRRRPSVNH
jgi:hypothetical protein